MGNLFSTRYIRMHDPKYRFYIQSDNLKILHTDKKWYNDPQDAWNAGLVYINKKGLSSDCIKIEFK
jgi:hypothetical protein